MTLLAFMSKIKDIFDDKPLQEMMILVVAACIACMFAVVIACWAENNKTFSLF